MIKTCIGCGASLQNESVDKIGYTKDLTLDLCERCFRIRHYGDYQVVKQDNASYLTILEEIKKTNDLVIFVIDLFNFNEEVYKLAEKITNPCLLVFTKRDLFAKDIYNQKFMKRIVDLPIKVVDACLISSKNNEGFDTLYQKIGQHKKSNQVFVVGLTNAGKSTMLNKLFKLYSDHSPVITTSMLPSTTLNSISIPFSEELTFVDTPGILDCSIANVVDSKMLKKIMPKNTIRPITYQIKVDQSILVEDFLRIDIQKGNNITLFFSNRLKITRLYKKNDHLLNLEKHVLDVPSNHDVMIAGLGFIKVVHACTLVIYTLQNVEVSIRASLI